MINLNLIETIVENIVIHIMTVIPILVISIFTEIMLRPSESYTFTHNKCYYNKYCVCENEGINQHKYIHVSLPKKTHIENIIYVYHAHIKVYNQSKII